MLGRFVFVGVGVVVLSGCQTTPPRQPQPAPPALHAKVSYRAVADKHLKHYTLHPGQSVVAPLQQPHNPEPIYPPELVARHLPPVDVTALLIVDTHGRVTQVRIASEASDDPVHKRFDAAVRKAALQWRFTPMRIADWAEDAQGNEHRVSADPKPFSQAYRFQFLVRDGKPVVSAGAPPAKE